MSILWTTAAKAGVIIGHIWKAQISNYTAKVETLFAKQIKLSSGSLIRAYENNSVISCKLMIVAQEVEVENNIFTYYTTINFGIWLELYAH